MRTLTKLTAAELRLYLREPLVVFFSLAFPTVLVGILGAVKAFREPQPGLGGTRVIDLYVTISIAMTLAMLGLQYAPAVLATYREKGILRRLATTPVPPVKLLTAQLAACLVAALGAVVLVLAFGRIVYAVPVPRQLLGFALALVLCAAAVFALGLCVAALAPTGKVGNAIGTGLFFPLMFFAGLWVPREAMGSVLRRIGDFTPLGAGEQALRDAAAGAWPHLGQLGVLVAYIVVCGAAAARLFRWE